MSTPARVSILLVTKNGERYVAEVLESVGQQQGPVQVCDIVAVDSGSRDRTVEILRRFGTTIVQIPPHEFSHGKTRNLAARHGQGDYLVFLTQDATPANADWLANLIAPLQADPDVAGAYGRHLPRPHCHPMEWRRIVELEMSGRPESRLYSAKHNPDYVNNPSAYYFFSNVSAVLRRSVWEQVPFPEVAFGEDQLWARRVLEAGYTTAYCADSLVYHSHGYGPWDNLCRHFDHARALLRGTPSHPPQIRLGQCIPAAFHVARADLTFWHHQNCHSKTRVLARWAVPAVSWHLAANVGLWLGERASQLPDRVCRFLSYQERIRRQ